MLHSLEAFWTSRTMVQTVMVICIVSCIGLWLGNIKISKFSLGGTCVFFVGILAAHLGARVNEEMLLFAQNFGLILFVYALGVQVGPGFMASFQKKGLALNLWGLVVIFLGTITAIILFYIFHPSMGNMMGVLSGAVTNTPALAAAQQAISQVISIPDSATSLSDMALACAITYPFGVIGVILVLEVLRRLFPHKMVQESNQKKKPYIGECLINNHKIIGKTLAEIHEMEPSLFVTSRLWHMGVISQPDADTVFNEGDHIIIVCDQKDAPKLCKLFGREVLEDEKINWSHDDRLHLVSRRLLVTKSSLNGVKLGQLRLRNSYGVNVTRINRSEIDLLPSPKLRLQIGDRLTVVGPQKQVEKLAQHVGNELKTLDTPYLFSIFLGIFLGCALGSIPILLPGLSQPVKLGIAGGPIIVGILMGAYGYKLHMKTYITQSANFMLRTLGLVIYLACLGISSGANFFKTISAGPGMIWLGLGAIITVLPVLLFGIYALSRTHLSYSVVGGIICGSMANPIALEYLNMNSTDDTPAVSYATVYPLAMFARVIIAQLIIVFFLA